MIVFQEQFLKFPLKDPTDFVLQSHVRGKSNHMDFRFAIDGKTLAGYTLVGVDGLSREPANLAEAKKLIKPGIEIALNRLSDHSGKTRAEPKSTQPTIWLRIGDREFAPGEIGATKNKKGWIITLEKAKLKFGAQLNDFHEYWVQGSKIKGRFLFRQLAQKTMRPSGEDAPPGEVFFWNAWFAKSQVPFVLSKRAVDEPYISPRGSSALPDEIEKLVPERFRYWKFSSESKRRAVRDELREAIKSNDVPIEISFSQDDPLEEFEATKPGPGRFSLQRRIFRGPIQVRVGPTRQIFDLRIALDNETQARHFVLDQDPRKNFKLSATLEAATGKDKLEIGRGGTKRVEPGTRLNPSKNTPAFVELLDSGPVRLANDSGMVKIFRFSGKTLNAQLVFTRQGKTNVFGVARSNASKKGDSMTDPSMRGHGPYPYKSPYPYPAVAKKAAGSSPYPYPTTGDGSSKVIKVIARLLGLSAVSDADKDRLKAIRDRAGKGQLSPRDIAFVSALRKKMGISLSDGTPFSFTAEFPHYPYDTSEFAERCPDLQWPVSLCEFGEECPAEGSDRKAACECKFAQEYGCPIFLQDITPCSAEEFENVSKMKDDLGIVDMKGIEIARTGEWNGIRFTEKDLEEIASNFNALKGELDVPLKLGHHEEQTLLHNSGELAAGWADRLYRQGKRLFVDASSVPKQVSELIKRRAFRKISMEMFKDFVDASGKRVGKTLKAISLLGSSTPAIRGMKNLDDVLALYQSELGEGVVLICCSEDSMDDNEEKKKTAEGDPNPSQDEEIVKLRAELESRKGELEALKSQQGVLTMALQETRIQRAKDANESAYKKLLSEGKVLPRQEARFKLLLGAIDAVADSVNPEGMFFSELTYDKEAQKFALKTGVGEDGKDQFSHETLKDLFVNFVADLEDQVDLNDKTHDMDPDGNRKIESISTGSAGDQLEKLAQELITKDDKLDYGEALARASRQMVESGIDIKLLNS